MLLIFLSADLRTSEECRFVVADELLSGSTDPLLPYRSLAPIKNLKVLSSPCCLFLPPTFAVAHISEEDYSPIEDSIWLL